MHYRVLYIYIILSHLVSFESHNNFVSVEFLYSFYWWGEKEDQRRLSDLPGIAQLVNQGKRHLGSGF